MANVLLSPLLLCFCCCCMLGLATSLSKNNNNNNKKAYTPLPLKWLPATATWYGSPYGAGSDGGACGYGSLANTPYGKMVASGGPSFFKGGKGCGTCYQVKCVKHRSCSPNPIRIVITDSCPGGPCAVGPHFDMGGFAFGQMAKIGQAATLRNAGHLFVLYKRVPCQYGKTTIAFEVNKGSNPNWFCFLIRYQSGDGDLALVELMQKYNAKWQRMKYLWGAYWCVFGGPVHGPFSIRLTSSSGRIVTSYNVIPKYWTPGATYKSNLII